MDDGSYYYILHAEYDYDDVDFYVRGIFDSKEAAEKSCTTTQIVYGPRGGNPEKN